MREVNIARAVPMAINEYHLYSPYSDRLFRPLGSLSLFGGEYPIDDESDKARKKNRAREAITRDIVKKTGLRFSTESLKLIENEEFTIDDGSSVQNIKAYSLLLEPKFSFPALSGEVITRNQAEIIAYEEELDITAQEIFRRLFYYGPEHN